MANANCSEHIEHYKWSPGEGLQMIGEGKSSTEKFVILPLNGIAFRTLELKVTNSKSSKARTESVITL